MLRDLWPDGTDDNGLVFVAPRGSMLAPAAISSAVCLTKFGGTLHGFRSSFRNYIAKTGRYRHAVESALAHSTARNEVEGAHLRTDLFDQRRAIMDEWAEYIMP